MVRVDDALLRQMTATIVEVADPEQVILFGSRCRGDAEADSDVDLVVVEAEPFGTGRDRGAEEARLWRALAKFHVPKDILVYSADEANRWRGSLNHVLARALREGRVLYERT
ncbi:MAG: nucleotidyltransferase domain-containing protein [Boseongicola sp.]|nr:nucleotidyltransferase domain-containing protein [Boseongicola sp.]